MILVGRVMVANRPEHSCRARIGTLDAVEVETAASSQLGEIAVCHLDELGSLPGWVGGTSASGFILHPTLTSERRARFTAQLAWRTARAAWTPEQRADPRIVPEHRDVVVRLPDGQTGNGLILDLSKTGAMIGLPHTLTVMVGSIVTVGKRYAVVVRATETGIAVRFRLPFSDQTFNASVVL